MARMRTLNAAVEYFKAQDPGTAITKHFLYKEARAGRLPGVVMAGSKFLLDIDRLEDFFHNGFQNTSEPYKDEKAYGQLRKVQIK